ncbi:MAG: orotidine-5'-phosphate decarboxylase [Oscillospiraceae bacterium]|jgi:orotidine-5'-phosphate decarboxylase|nr:orotidine-5'-phosphate decarboxylase [Oscillospiraceae bacterium]MCI1989956.1 orotidine-5'-phosphate decarboxylase [Oscillospiraceae bacterium]MCI2034986.1 orotidine-5'-phosphate decarboxylase [Oscillospiraceae bacterium]
MAFDRLIEKIAELQNPTVAGLDPRLEFIPAFIREKAFARYGKTPDGAAAAILEFNKGIIDALCPVVPAVKPQCAFYEMYGWQGMKALHDTIAYAKAKGMFVITDGKRNDIGSTMAAYAAAHLGKTDVGGEKFEAFGADALTVNGYLGSDGVTPLLSVCRERGRGIFILVKTSNPSSDELQNRPFKGGETLYEAMGRFCEEWGKSLPGKHGYSGVGAVVGATWPDQLRELRRALPRTFFLVPGYGAQGGTADDAAPAFDKNGLGAVVNASRSILCAWQKRGAPQEDYAKCAREEAVRMRGEIMKRLGEIRLETV